MKKILVTSALGMLVTLPVLAQHISQIDQILEELAVLDNGAYFMNSRFTDASGATESDYDRYQIDLSFNF